MKDTRNIYLLPRTSVINKVLMIECGSFQKNYALKAHENSKVCSLNSISMSSIHKKSLNLTTQAPMGNYFCKLAKQDSRILQNIHHTYPDNKRLKKISI